jgi:hypothetical protein
MPLKLDIEFMDDAEFVRSLPAPLVTLGARGGAEKPLKSCCAVGAENPPWKLPVGVGTEGSPKPPAWLLAALVSA